MSYRVFLNEDLSTWQTKVWVIKEGLNDLAVAEPVEFVFKEHERGIGAPQEPTFSFDRDFEKGGLLAAFAQAAWEKGWRPHGHKDEVSAMDNHLQDMRKLVFHLNDMKITGA